MLCRTHYRDREDMGEKWRQEGRKREKPKKNKEYQLIAYSTWSEAWIVSLWVSAFFSAFFLKFYVFEKNGAVIA